MILPEEVLLFIAYCIMKKVYFITRSKMYGSAIMRGYQICRWLRQNGINAHVVDLSSNCQKVRKIKDSIVVFVKNTIAKQLDLAVCLQENKNVLLWDIIDTTIEKSDPHPELFEDAIKIFDGVIFPNYQSKLDWSCYVKKSCQIDAIYHHWDPRLKPNRANDFRLVHIGGPENLKDDYIANIPELNSLIWRGYSKMWSLSRKILSYNCHFSIAKEGSNEFKYKSNMKLSNASATNSNIILTRNHGYAELLDGSYPYYTSSGLPSVIRTVKYAKETYMTNVWHKALDMMREVRERTHINRIGKEYVQYLDRF